MAKLPEPASLRERAVSRTTWGTCASAGSGPSLAARRMRETSAATRQSVGRGGRRRPDPVPEPTSTVRVEPCVPAQGSELQKLDTAAFPEKSTPAS